MGGFVVPKLQHPDVAVIGAILGDDVEVAAGQLANHLCCAQQNLDEAWTLARLGRYFPVIAYIGTPLR